MSEKEKKETGETGRNKKIVEKNNLFKFFATNSNYSELEEKINSKNIERNEFKTVKLENIESKEFVAKNKQQKDKTPITWVSNDILDDPYISATAKGIYMILKRHYNDSWGYARMSYKKLGELSQIKHPATLKKYLVELIQRGYVQVLEPKTDKQKKKKEVYHNEIYLFQVRTLYRSYSYEQKVDNQTFTPSFPNSGIDPSEFQPDKFDFDDDDMPF